MFLFTKRKYCGAALLAGFAIVTACASGGYGADRQYAAHGYLTPGLASDPEIIGIFDSVSKCREAADAWASRQVVGNPIHAECYPVDRN